MNIIELTKKAVELVSKDEKLKERTKDTVTSIVMVLKNEEEHSFTLAVNKGKLEFLEEGIADPDFQFEMSEKDYADLMTGKAYGMILMARGKMKMTKGSWAQIGKIATPLGMIPKAGKDIATKEKSKAAKPLAADKEKLNVLAKVRRRLKQRMKGRSAKHVQISCEGLEAVNKEKEKEFAAEREKARLIDAMPDALVVLDLNGVILSLNPAHTRMFGHKPEERIGKSFDELGKSLKTEDIEKFMKLLRKLTETGHVEPVETVIRAKDGREIPASVTYSLIKDDEGNPRYIIALLRDITELKRLQEKEKEVAAMAERAAIIDAMIDGVLVHDLDGRIISANKALEDMTGYKLEENVGKSLFEFLKPEELEKATAALAELLEKGKVGPTGLTLPTKDGREIPIQFLSSTMKEAQGKPLYGISVIRDITEHKRAEEQLLQSEKLAGMGLLASSIAHELGNPLSIMSSTLQYTRDALLNTGNRKLIEGIDTIMDSIGQMHELLRSLSEFTGSQQPHFESTDLRRILSLMLSFIHKEAEIHKIKVYHQFDENLPNCQVDPGKIKQLFLNLFKNAIEAMPNAGELHARMYLLDSKDAVCIEVSDTGHGISETDLRSIFRPFYSTKPGGTGLGLSFCRRVVEEHEGEITVKSELGKGSTFSVILPARQKGTDKSDE